MYTQNFVQNLSLKKSEFFQKKSLQSLKLCDIVRDNQDLGVLKGSNFREWSSFDNFIIFGTGGSSLGGQVIYAVSGRKNLRFVGNLDPTTFKELFDTIDTENTGLLFVSKSGETLETLAQLSLVMEFANDAGISKDYFAVITENKLSSLRKAAEQYGFLCLDHPMEIGGRYSVFSLVGMVPAVLCGLDPFKIREGGRRVLEDFSNEASEIDRGANFLLEHLDKNISNHVSFIYSEKLINFGYWLAQLYAESTGKQGKGITPLTAIGSLDQHSQLQLYLDGPADKCFTFFYEKQESDGIIDNDFLGENFSYLNGKSIADIFKCQCEATKKVLIDKGCNVRTIEIPPINEEILGGLFMHFMLETACVCNAMGVNPFDQPAVEKGKILTKELLTIKGDLL